MTAEVPRLNRSEALPEAQYIERMKLAENKAVEIDTTQVLLGKEGVQEAMGVDGAMVAEIRASDMSFLVIDTRDSRYYSTPFLITTDGYQHGSKMGFKGVHREQPAIVGRSQNDRFSYSDYISANQFSVRYDDKADKLYIQDWGSTNGTYLTGFINEGKNEAKHDGIRDEFTHFVVEDMEGKASYGDRTPDTPYGTHLNYAIIGRNSPSVRGGVYGTRSSEFVIVDDKSQALKKVVDGFMEALLKSPDVEAFSTMNLLKRINFRVANVLTYDLERVERISEPHYDHKGLIGLSEYIEQGVGVCRHQALLAAHLIEEVIDRGYLTGKASVERNHDLEANGAHAWAVYKSDTEDDIIVDAAQGFVGSRQKAREEGRWRYVVANDDN